MKTLFVTGGAGFIGAHFVRYWLSANPQDCIITYDALTYAGNLASLSDVIENHAGRHVFIQGDIRDKEQLVELFKHYRPDYVINFAAETHNSRAVLSPTLFFETNVIGTQQLLQASVDADIPHFHHVSTCEVYGDLALESDQAFLETSAYQPNTPYSASKAAADLAVRAYAKTYQLPVTLSNACNNYGPFQYPEKLIPFFVTSLLKGRNLLIYENSHYCREWLHVEDHCRGIERVLKTGQLGETYHIGSGFERSVQQIADHLLTCLRESGCKKQTVPDRPGHDRRYLLNSEKIQKTLGWRPQISFTEGLADTVAWYQNHSDWWEPLVAAAEIREDAW